MHGIALLAAVALSGVSPSGSTQPLNEVSRTVFETPYSPPLYYAGHMAVSSRAPIGYAVSHEDVFVVGTSDGAVDDVLDLRPFPWTGYGGAYDVVLCEEGGAARLVAWRANAPLLVVFDATNPAHPTLERTIALPRPPIDVSAIPGSQRVLVRAGKPFVVDLDLGAFLYDFEPKSGSFPFVTFGATAVGGTASRALVAIADTNFVAQTGAVAVYEASQPYATPPLVVLDTPGYVDRILLDRDGRYLLTERRTSFDPVATTFRVVSLPGGEVLADITPAGGGWSATLVQSAGASVLATLDPAGVDLIDLADPASPRVIGRVEAPIDWLPFTFSGGDLLVASPSAPYVFAVDRGDRQVLSIDATTARIAGRLDVAPAPPGCLAIGESPGGTRSILVSAIRLLDASATIPGGTAELRTVDASDPAMLRATGRILRNQPRFIDDLAVVDGSLGVALDYASNAIALVRLKDGKVLDVSGFTAPTGDGNDTYGQAKLFARGPWVLAWGEGGYDEFLVRHDRLEHVAGDHDPYAQIFSARLSPDGVVVMDRGVYPDRWEIETRAPDGGVGHLEMASHPHHTNLALAPDGESALFGSPYDWDEPGHARDIDLTDPLHPAWGWVALPSFWSAAYTPDSRRLFVTFVGDNDYSFRTGLFDPKSGAALGPIGDPVDKFFYEDIGVLLGNRGAGRAVLWEWTWQGWKTLLFDTSGATPRLMKDLPEYYVAPEFAPRDDQGWYEVHPGGDVSTILVSDADGNQTVAAVHDGFWDRSPRELRRGFLATANGWYTGGAAISLWRDVALNRPPVAAAGNDRTLECAAPSGTPAHLDGSGSTDPDSTPGTNDDIVSYAWSGAGQSANGVEVDLALPLGETSLSLTVTDALGLSASDAAQITVQDTLPPEVSLDLEPDVTGGIWAQLWTPTGSASDVCDGDLGAPAERLALPDGAATAETRYVPAAALSIELRRPRSGDLVAKLEGPDKAAVRAVWEAAKAGSGFPLTDGAPVGLVLAPAGTGRDAALVARYDLDEAGALVRATVYGEGSDLTVDAAATDAAGHAATTVTSLRATRDALCAAAPDNAICVGSVTGASSPASSPARTQSGRVAATLR